MVVNWTDRLLLFASAAILFGLQAGPIMGQHGGSGAPGGASGAGGGTGAGAGSIGGIAGAGTRGTTSSIPGLEGTGTTSGNYGRPIFLSGKVLFDDGSPANPNIRIERICGGNVRLEAHTDSKGGFSFRVGDNQSVDTDASDDSPGTMRGTPGSYGGGNSTGMQPSQVGGLGTGRGNGTNPLWNCELRAAYPGYISDTIDLANRRALDDPNVGTIILRRAANVKGSTISAISAEAPKKAQKDYEKGMQLAQKGDLEQAEKRLREAVDLYPKYALAWFAIGGIKEQENNLEEARKAYTAAAGADNKYVSPLDRLALLSAHQGKWQDAADYSKQVIDLNPIEFPNSFWCSAVANFNMKRYEEAQKSANALVKLDTRHKYPEAERMLAQIALSKDDYTDAAAHLRSYLALNPNAKDADSLKQSLLKIDQANATAKN